MKKHTFEAALVGLKSAEPEGWSDEEIDRMMKTITQGRRRADFDDGVRALATASPEPWTDDEIDRMMHAIVTKPAPVSSHAPAETTAAAPSVAATVTPHRHPWPRARYVALALAACLVALLAVALRARPTTPLIAQGPRTPSPARHAQPLAVPRSPERSPTRSAQALDSLDWDIGRAQFDGHTTTLRPYIREAGFVVLELVRGEAEFEQRHTEGSVLRVLAGPVLVEDVGTKFTVSLQGDGSVRLHVTEGEVRVTPTSTGESHELQADASEVIAPDGTPFTSTTAASTVVSRLLAAADRAENRGQLSVAEEILRGVLPTYRADPQASTAALHLGRLLQQRGRRAEAAAEYRTAFMLGRATVIREFCVLSEYHALNPLRRGGHAP